MAPSDWSLVASGPGLPTWLSRAILRNDYFGLRTSITRESGASYNGFFAVNGVTLSAAQYDRSVQVYTIDPDPDVNARACGSNDSPLYANFAKEVNP